MKELEWNVPDRAYIDLGRLSGVRGWLSDQGDRMRRERRRPTRAAYGADYTRNLRWRYRQGHGSGSESDPYLSGGSFGVGYGRAWGSGPESSRTPYEEERTPGERRRWRRPGTAARDYDRAYPYFGSAAAVEAAQGYPPGDSLGPEALPPHDWPLRRWYDEDYD